MSRGGEEDSTKRKTSVKEKKNKRAGGVRRVFLVHIPLVCPVLSAKRKNKKMLRRNRCFYTLPRLQKATVSVRQQKGDACPLR
jgi:hypothetical protein